MQDQTDAVPPASHVKLLELGMSTAEDTAEESSEITAVIEDVDPARAIELLANMTPNRRIRRLKVERYAADMLAGWWRLTGEAIKIGRDGKVLDGEHRLRAIIKSGCTIRTLMIYGVEIEARIALDTGVARSFADFLRFKDETNCNELAAAVSQMYLRSHKLYWGGGGQYPSHQVLFAELERHPGIRDSLLATRRAASLLRMPRGLCAALHYDMANLDATDADDFWNRLYTGEYVIVRDAVAVLRKRMEENAMTRGKKLDTMYIHVFIIKAWNAYRERREIAHLRWTRGGANPEPFPELV